MKLDHLLRLLGVSFALIFLGVCGLGLQDLIDATENNGNLDTEISISVKERI